MEKVFYQNGSYWQENYNEHFGYSLTKITRKRFLTILKQNKQQETILINLFQDLLPRVLQFSLFIGFVVLFSPKAVLAKEYSSIDAIPELPQSIPIQKKQSLFEEIKRLSYKISTSLVNKITANKLKSAALILGATTVLTTGLVYRQELYWLAEDFVLGTIPENPLGWDPKNRTFDYFTPTSRKFFNDHIQVYAPRAHWSYQRENLEFYVELLKIIDENLDRHK